MLVKSLTLTIVKQRVSMMYPVNETVGIDDGETDGGGVDGDDDGVVVG